MPPQFDSRIRRLLHFIEYLHEFGGCFTWLAHQYDAHHVKDTEATCQINDFRAWLICPF
jgi:hypothetical protein